MPSFVFCINHPSRPFDFAISFVLLYLREFNHIKFLKNQKGKVNYFDS